MKTVLIGADPKSHHSLRKCEDLTDALAFMWFLAHSPNPERAWLFQGLDGWLSNAHMGSKPIPKTLTERVQTYFDNDIPA